MSTGSDSGGEEKTTSPQGGASRSPSLNNNGDTATIESEEELLGRLGYKQVHPFSCRREDQWNELTGFFFLLAQEFIREFTNLSTISFAFSISAFIPVSTSELR